MVPIEVRLNPTQFRLVRGQFGLQLPHFFAKTECWFRPPGNVVERVRLDNELISVCIWVAGLYGCQELAILLGDRLRPELCMLRL